MHTGDLVMTYGAEKDYVVSNSPDQVTGINTVRIYERARAVAIGTPWTRTDSIVDSYYYGLAFANGRLYASLSDGLYYKQVETVTAVPNIINNINEIRVFPNPSTGRAVVHLELTERKKISVQVFDLTGKMISMPYSDLNLNTGKEDLPVDLSRLQSSVYFIRILSGNEQHTEKVVVKH
jgi:hypothetical protein